MLTSLFRGVTLARGSQFPRLSRSYSSQVRVRFAPSPTGHLHLGGLRTALFNYLFAKKSGGAFLLRIEDTDRSRFVPGATEGIVESLEWAGITFDEGPGKGGPYGPYFQSERNSIYQQHIQQLLECGHAYKCFCKPERLEQLRVIAQKSGRTAAYDRRCLNLTQTEIDTNIANGEPYTIRMKAPDHSIEVDDVVYGKVHFASNVLDDAILIKSDGFPTYHFANVVDDHSMGISHVMRGEEWISSTPKHIALYQAFQWDVPQFVHLPLLLNPDKSKLSKRSGDVHVNKFKENGFLPEALVNFVALLGWNPHSTQEIFSMEELIEQFSLENINKSSPMVQRDKLVWMNKQHIIKKCEDPAEREPLIRKLRHLLGEKFTNLSVSDEYLTKVLGAEKERISKIEEIPEACSYFFTDPDYTTPEAALFLEKLNKSLLVPVLETTLEKYKALPNLQTPDAVQALFKEIAQEHQVKVTKIQPILRYMLTATKAGPSMVDLFCILGKDRVLERCSTLIGKQTS
ncbi:glutamyl-tRNA synthetase [Basidiobolus meristosporus CBS 931.73]|uniref:Glutamate--tRNA ligase, mitochondrial n=1 Tax=Basidiobolus meristosporus CBS 931.73 TaxID=1314790 RepID=A0A1Y1ZDY6_9FUNG|nr:glutamyl-tRNA synthetase [Basidiobolus meristosporus CBS 931.73]|eukprot:ORY08416.1 glutamyl-tRNA synthetase [Basidiobolus meristosporus CBS 931.73]